MNILKFPIIKKFYTQYVNKIDFIERRITFLSQENIELRHKIKSLKKEKIKVVFVCWRPSVWGSLKTVYEAMKEDEAFDVKILTTPNKKLLPKIGVNHEIYETEGAEEFWTGEDVISGYNYKTGEWIDLRSLEPDYVCFQQPYNECRPENERSGIVSTYAKIFYVAYGYNTVKDLAIECWRRDFVDDTSLYFAQSQTELNWYTEYAKLSKRNYSKAYLTGFPRFDDLEKYKNVSCDVWKLNKTSSMKILWTPRWCTNENNCHFFAYKDNFVNLIKNNEEYDFIFRPHPQAFLNWEYIGALSKTQRENYLKEYETSNNMNIDYSKDYLPIFYTSDVLITDYSSIIPEYLLTGKPIIYCKNDDSLYDPEGRIAQCFYYVRNWNELQSTLEMIKRGEDSLKEIRREIIQSEFYLGAESSGFRIKEIIKSDFNK